MQETGSDLAAELWDGCNTALASRLAYPEVRAALAAAGRNHDLSDDDLDTAEETWAQFWAAVRPVELTAAVERHAGKLARSRSLRGADRAPGQRPGHWRPRPHHRRLGPTVARRRRRWTADRPGGPPRT